MKTMDGDRSKPGYHFGPDVTSGIGAAMVHAMVHERALGKTIVRVYLGDNPPFRGLTELCESCYPGNIFRSEYLAFKFSDGSTLMLQVAAGNSFHVAFDDEARTILGKAEKRRNEAPRRAKTTQ